MTLRVEALASAALFGRVVAVVLFITAVVSVAGVAVADLDDTAAVGGDAAVSAAENTTNATNTTEPFPDVRENLSDPELHNCDWMRSAFGADPCQ